jgi:hypothetical protein
MPSKTALPLGVASTLNVHEEMVEPWPTGPEDNPVAAPVYVCDDCDVTVEDRDPVLDRLEAAYD